MHKRARAAVDVSGRPTSSGVSGGDLGCDQAQGYLFAYPTPVGDLTTSIM
jgi:hypothetical protein